MLSVSHLKNKRWSMRIWNGCTIHFSKMWHEIQSVAVTKSFKWSFLLIKWLQISPEISIYPKTSGRWTLCHIVPLSKEDCNPLKNCVKIQCTTIAGQKLKTWLYSKIVLVSLIYLELPIVVFESLVKEISFWILKQNAWLDFFGSVKLWVCHLCICTPKYSKCTGHWTIVIFHTWKSSAERYFLLKSQSDKMLNNETVAVACNDTKSFSL